jgi:hypothetical protein
MFLNPTVPGISRRLEGGKHLCFVLGVHRAYARASAQHHDACSQRHCFCEELDNLSNHQRSFIEAICLDLQVCAVDVLPMM